MRKRSFVKSVLAVSVIWVFIFCVGVSAENFADIQSSADYVSITSGSILPSVPILKGGPPEINNWMYYEFQWEPCEDDTTKPDDMVYEVRIKEGDSGERTDTTNRTKYSWAPKEDGQITFRVCSVDADGNKSEFAEYTFTRYTQRPPTVRNLRIEPAPVEVVNNTISGTSGKNLVVLSPTFKLIWDKVNVIGQENAPLSDIYYLVKIQDKTYVVNQPTEGDQITLDVNEDYEIKDDWLYIIVYAIDSLGNRSKISEDSVITNVYASISKPEISDLTYTNYLNTSSQYITSLEWNSPINDGVCIVGTNKFTIEVRNSMGNPVYTTVQEKDLGTAGWTSHEIEKLLEEGIYTAYITPYDNVGRVGNTLSTELKIDYTPPAIPRITTIPDQYTNKRSITIEWEKPNDDEAVEYHLQIEIPGTDTHSSTVKDEKYTFDVDSDGKVTFRVRAEDSSGNKSDFAVYEFNVDTVSPEPPNDIDVINSAQLDGLYTTSDINPTFKWDQVNNACQYILTVGDKNYKVSQSDENDIVEFKLLEDLKEDATYKVCVTSVDFAGNESVESPSIDLKFERTETHLPDIISLEIEKKNDLEYTAYWNLNTDADVSSVDNYIVQVISNDFESDVIYECELKHISGSDRQYTDIILETLSDGIYGVRIKLIDRDGFVSAWYLNEKAIIKDHDNPSIPVFSVMPLSFTNEAECLFQWSAEDDVTSREDLSYKCETQINGTVVVHYNLSEPRYSWTPEKDGVITFRVKAIDEAGNESAEWAEYTFNRDTNKPNSITGLGLASSSDAENVVNTPLPEFIWNTGNDESNYDEGYMSGIKCYELSVNGESSYERCYLINNEGTSAGQIAFRLPESIENGKYVATIRCQDNCANWSAKESIEFVVFDTTPLVDNLYIDSTEDILTIKWNADVGQYAPGDVKIKEYVLKVIDLESTENVYQATIPSEISEHVFTNDFEDGFYAISLTAIDTVGNSSVKEENFNLDRISPTAPEITAFPDEINNCDNYDFRWNESRDDVSGISKYVVNVFNSDRFQEMREIDAAEDRSYTWNYVQDGEITFKVYAVDNSGNIGTCSEYKFTSDRTVPTNPEGLTLISPNMNSYDFIKWGIDQLGVRWNVSNDILINGVSSGIDHYEVNLVEATENISDTKNYIVRSEDEFKEVIWVMSNPGNKYIFSLNVVAVDKAGNKSDPSDTLEFIWNSNEDAGLMALDFTGQEKDNIPTFEWIGVQNFWQDDFEGEFPYDGMIENPVIVGYVIDLFSGTFNDINGSDSSPLLEEFIPHKGDPLDKQIYRLTRTLDDGQYVFYVCPSTEGGDEGEGMGTEFIIDTTSPQIPDNLVIESEHIICNNEVFTRESSPVFSWDNVTTDITGKEDLSGIDHYSVNIYNIISSPDGQEVFNPVINQDETKTTTYNTGYLDDGIYVIEVSAVDGATIGGNKGDSAEYIFKIDTTGPLVNGNSGLKVINGLNSSTPEFTWNNVVDELSDVSRYVIYIRPNGTQPGDKDESSYVFEVNGQDQELKLSLPEPMKDGKYSVRLTAEDALGNVSNSSEDLNFDIKTTFDDGIFKYRILDDGTLEIIEYMGNGGDVYVPGDVDGMQVTSIGRSAFADDRGIKTPRGTVTIPEGITTIGDRAFNGWYNLNAVYIPLSVVNIGDNIFNGCKELKVYGYSGSDMEYYALNQGVPFIDRSFVSGDFFYRKLDDGSIEITEYIGDGGYVDIPEQIEGSSVTSIGKMAFYRRDDINGLSISNTVVQIGESAFEYCDGITEVHISDNVMNIGKRAFRNCPNLKIYGGTGSCAHRYAESDNIAFLDPSSTLTYDGFVYKEIGDQKVEIVNYIGNADHVYVPAFIEGKAVVSIGISAFSGNTGIRELDIDDKIEEIKESAFYACTNLEYITLPDQLSKLERGILRECSSLKSINIPYTVNEISSIVFLGCNSLVDVEIPDGVTHIGESAFGMCSGLERVVVPESVVEMFPNTFLLSHLVTIYGYRGSYAETYASEMALPFVAMDEVYGDFKYKTIDQHNVEIVKYTGKKTTVIIPDEIDGIPVTSIGNMAFYRQTFMSNVIFPSNLKKIGDDVFASCRSLDEIVVPDGVIHIGDSAFDSCEKLIRAFVPSSVTSIGEGAFSGCDLLSIYGEKDSIISVYSNSNGITFIDKDTIDEFNNFEYRVISPDQVEITKYHGTSSIITIPSVINGMNVVGIGQSAFAYQMITDINIPRGVKYIEDGAFYDNKNLRNITLPDSMESIGNNAFGNCTRLSQVVMPESITYISEKAFSGCQDVITIYGNSGSYAEEYAIRNSLKFVDISIEHIYGDFGYRNLDNNEIEITRYLANGYNVTVPSEIDGKNVVKIGINAFSECSNLQSVELPERINEIENGAFYYCTNLKQIDIPKSVIRIGDNAFRNCRSLVNIMLHAGIESIGTGAFYNCTSLNSIEIPSDVLKIEDNTFYGCSNLLKILLPDDLAYISDTAFQGCPSLIIYSRSGSYSEEYAKLHDIVFIDNDSLNEFGEFQYRILEEGTVEITKYTGEGYVVTIPDSIQGKEISSLGNGAFLGCELVKEIIIPYGLSNIGSGAFANCTNLTNIDIPDTVTEIGASAFYKCIKLVNVTIQQGIITIEDNIFNGCYSLTAVEIPNGVSSIGYRAFYRCSNLKSLNIPDGVTYIYSGAFSDCSSLSKVFIPDSVISISESVFYQCDGLIIYGNDGSYAMEYAKANGIPFIDINQVKKYDDFEYKLLEDSTIEIIRYVGNSLNIVVPYEIDGHSVIRIGDRAFSVNSLRSITIPESVNYISSDAFFYQREMIIYGKSGSYAQEYAQTNGIEFKDTDGVQIEGDFEYIKLPDGTLQISRYTGNDSDVIIPSEINGSLVTSIGDYVFYQCSTLKRIVIQPGIRDIGDYAFAFCSGLNEIRLPSSVVDVGRYAFYNCNNIVNVALSPGMTEIKENTFAYCKRITSVTIPEKISKIEAYSFAYCTSMFYASVPASVTSISQDAFQGCDVLNIYGQTGSAAQEYAISNGVTFIDIDLIVLDGDFEYRKLEDGTLSVTKYTGYEKTVVVPSAVGQIPVTEISASAFYNRSDLSYIEITYGIMKIGEYAFAHCSGLNDLVVPTSVTDIEDGAFYNCGGLETVELPDGITRIGDNAFALCVSLKNVNLPEKLTDIGEYAFAFCSSIEEIDIPSGVSTIGSNAFYNCSGLTTITLPSAINRIDNSTFAFCKKLTKTIVPNNVSSIGNYAFAYCDVLSQVIMTENVREIENDSFIGCGTLTIYGPVGSYVQRYSDENEIPFELTSIFVKGDFKYSILEDGTVEITEYLGTSGNVEIPSQVEDLTGSMRKVTRIGRSVFENNLRLTSVTIPNGVTQIGTNAFTNCTNLITVDTSGVVELRSVRGFARGTGSAGLGDNAFNGCINLEKVKIPDGISRIGGSAFDGCIRLTLVEMHEGITTIGDRAFNECTNIERLHIPPNVTEIGNYVFNGCSRISEIVIPPSVQNIGTGAFEGSTAEVYVYSDAIKAKLEEDGVNCRQVSEVLAVDNLKTDEVSSGKPKFSWRVVNGQAGQLSISGFQLEIYDMDKTDLVEVYIPYKSEEVVSYTYEGMLSDGEYISEIKVIDNMENTLSSQENETKFVIYTRKPVIAEVTVYSMDQTAEVSWAANLPQDHPTQVAISGYDLQLYRDNGSECFEPVPGSQVSTEMSQYKYEGLQDGKYMVSVNAKDTVGNKGDPVQKGFTVDTVVQNASEFECISGEREEKPLFQWRQVEEDLSGVRGYKIEIYRDNDGKPETVVDEKVEHVEGTQIVKYRIKVQEGLPNGEYTVYLITLDNAGNETKLEESPKTQIKVNLMPIKISTLEINGYSGQLSTEGMAINEVSTVYFEITNVPQGEVDIRVKVNDKYVDTFYRVDWTSDDGTQKYHLIIDQSMLVEALTDFNEALKVVVEVNDGLIGSLEEGNGLNKSLHTDEKEVSCKIRNYRTGFGFGRLRLKDLM